MERINERRKMIQQAQAKLRETDMAPWLGYNLSFDESP